MNHSFLTITLENVREVVADVLENQHIRGFKEDASLVESGIISSLEIVVLAVALEKRFGVSLPDSAITIQNFKNIQSLTTLIQAQKAGTAGITLQKNTQFYSKFSLFPAMKRPVRLILCIILFFVFIDIGLHLAIMGPFYRQYLRFMEEGERLYPFSGGYSQDDLAFAVTHHAINKTQEHLSPRIAIFGDSGTIGSWVKAEESIPAYVQSTLQKTYSTAKVYNMAFFMQYLPKDLMILEAVLAKNQDSLPFDVVVFTLGDHYFYRPFIDNLPGLVPYLSVNQALLRKFSKRFSEDEREPFESLANDLDLLHKNKISYIETLLKKYSALYHYAPFFRYVFDKRPYIVPLNQNYNFMAQHVMGEKSLFSPVPQIPPKDFAISWGIAKTDVDTRMISMLNSTIALLRRYNIPVILYLKPHGPKEWHTLYIQHKGQQPTVKEILQAISKKNQCKILDLRWVLSGSQFTDSEAHYSVEANRIIGQQIANVILLELNK